MKGIRISGRDKCIITGLIIITMAALMAIKVVSEGTGCGIIGACLGYIFGNGHGIIESKGKGVV